MSETGPIETGILALILLACLWYVTRSLKRMFSSDPRQRGGGCGGCSKNAACPTKGDPPHTRDDPPA